MRPEQKWSVCTRIQPGQ